MTLEPIKFYVVEDEPSNRAGMIKLLTQGKETSVVGEADSVSDAFKGILQKKPTALMLDIKLYEGDAFMLLQRLRDHQFIIPPTVIVTGHLDFELAQEALNRFRDHVVYILQKPFLEGWNKKYEEICDAIRSYQVKENFVKAGDTTFMFRSGNQTFRIKLSEIEYIEVGGNGSIIIHTDFGKEVKVYKTLTQFLSVAPPEIVKVHRKYAVHKEKINYIDHEDRLIFLNGHQKGISIGEAFYQDICDHLL